MKIRRFEMNLIVFCRKNNGAAAKQKFFSTRPLQKRLSFDDQSLLGRPLDDFFL
jgi:hypothetical protein